MSQAEKLSFLTTYWNAENVWAQKPGKKISGAVQEREVEAAPEEGRTQMPLAAPPTRSWKSRLLLLVCYAVLVPVTIWAGCTFLENRKYLLISLLLFAYVGVPFFFRFERRKPKARELVLIATLSALTVAARLAFYMVPNFKPVAAMIILAASVFGSEAGVLVACTSVLVSNFLFGQGPWTPWQMLAYGCIGYLAGALFATGRVQRERKRLCLYGFLSVVFLFGGIMNPASLIMYSAEISWQKLLAIYISGLPIDLLQAASTVIFLWIGAKPMIEKEERIKIKYGL